MAEKNGISPRCVNLRIRNRAWGKKEAIIVPPQKRRDRSELVAIAKSNGIPYGPLMARLHLGWNEIRATTTPVRDAKGQSENAIRMCQMNRKYPLEFVELAAKNGIQYKTFTHRMRNGWGLERAATTTPAYSNGAKRLKELYGENYLREMTQWIFIKRKGFKTPPSHQ